MLFVCLRSFIGGNVGDVAGMGADLFESFVGSIIAAATLANGDATRVALPFWIAGAGIFASVIGFFAVSCKDGASQRQLMMALHKGVILSSVFVLGLSAIIISQLFDHQDKEGWKLFACITIGLVAGILIGQATEYYTSYSFWPTQSITQAGVTGPATVIIQGLGIGMISTVGPVLILVATILGCNALSGEYGIGTYSECFVLTIHWMLWVFLSISNNSCFSYDDYTAMSAVGMLSTLGVTLATDAYGPIADNAGGIAEMAELEERVRETTDALDALGNTTAATGKGFAIGSAVLTSLSLLAAFKDKAGITTVDMGDPVVVSGMLFGKWKSNNIHPRRLYQQRFLTRPSLHCLFF